MTVIIKDNEGRIVAEKELSEKDCTIKVSECANGEKQYNFEQTVGSYH